MRLGDIVEQLQRVLPAKTDRFHDTFAIVSIIATATSATVTTSKAHNLVAGDIVTLAGVETRTPIVAAATDGLLTAFDTATDHDLTENNPDTPTVPLTGFTDPLWNTDQELIAVPNRRQFVVRNNLSAPVLNGGELLLEPNRNDGINGLFEVNPLTRDSFVISGTFIPGTYTPIAGIVASGARVAKAVSIERAEQLYDEAPSQFWAFVIPETATVSKDRATDSDAISSLMDGNSMRLRLLDDFAVVVFAPAADELAADEAMDICRHDLLGPIVSALYGTRPLTGLACPISEFRITFTGHQVFSYNKAVLSYLYTFQAPSDLSSDDAVVLAADRAFRDIDYAHTGFHTDLTVTADLDTEPLP